MKSDILGVLFDNVSRSEAVEQAMRLMEEKRGAYIVTANPEIVLRCREDKAYAAAVNAADLVLADGIGDLYAARILGTPLTERVTGADTAPELLSRLAEKGGSVFLYGGRPGVAERAARFLRSRFPGLCIAGTENGYISREDDLFGRINDAKPDLLLAALGAPRQELWMQKNAARLNVGLMMGVGGLFDVWAGDVKRAPELWQKLGLEWLFRLVQEPKRVSRMAKLPKILILAAGERLKK